MRWLVCPSTYYLVPPCPPPPSEPLGFDVLFRLLKQHDAFPWQRTLYQSFASGDFPSVCDIPTGLGKTSLIYLWLLAHHVNPSKVPRRLVYVVNRRTVVDQASNEATQLRSKLEDSILGDLRISVSTLRGELSDAGEWRQDPSRPAIVIGTIDLIGSALLFSSYRAGRKHRPFHAGLLGQDTLLIHDEAHLSHPFQQLLSSIETEQRLERATLGKPLRVIALTATPHSRPDAPKPFGLSDADRGNADVRKRLDAKKGIAFHQVGSEKATVAEKVAELALRYKDVEGLAILVFVSTLKDIDSVVAQFRRAKLSDNVLKVLTGTIRGYERDQLVNTAVFKRFLSGEKVPDNKTVFIVANSAGEVGIDISADHLVCDLSSFESMAQRLGRVNRRGDGDATVDVVHPQFGVAPEKPLDIARKRTLELLKGRLPQRVDGRHDGSPEALRGLPLSERQAAFSPQPPTLPASDILFDSWALTTADELPGRPPVDAWLHGNEEDEGDTHFAWRAEVELLRLSVMGEDWLRERTKQVRDLMEEYPLKSAELLRVKTSDVKEHLKKFAKRSPEALAWVLGRRAEPRLTTLNDLAEGDYPDFVGRTIVLDPRSGGLTAEGRLDGGAMFSSDILYDVADLTRTDKKPTRRRFEMAFEDGEPKYLWNGVEQVSGAPDVNGRLPGMTLVADIRLEESEDGTSRSLLAYAGPGQVVGDEAQSRNSIKSVLLADHNAQVERLAGEWAEQLGLPPDVQTAVRIAARCHDLGKDRGVWQRSVGNRDHDKPLAKSGHSRSLQGLEGYRHEFGSAIDVHADPVFASQTDDVKTLALHLIAAHHGYGRPHFPPERAFDPQTPHPIWCSFPGSVSHRFGKLQATYGRWGLAYLESLIRAADIEASQRPTTADPPLVVPRNVCQNPLPLRDAPTPTITVKVDVTNPGQFFACCGLLELADRLWPGAEGWFADGEFRIACAGTLDTLLDQLASCRLTNTMSAEQFARLDLLSEMKGAVRAKTKGLDEEKKSLEKLVREEPILLKGPFNFRIDWFLDDSAGGSRFKTWAGQQSVLRISEAMKQALAPPAWRDPLPADWLTRSVVECGLPFNFDSDLGAQGGAIDVGFSFDPLAGSALTRIESSARPALELLAFIGLQRFRPREIKGENRFVYATWERAQPVTTAMPAACGAVPLLGGRQYEFRLLYRTKYLKSFLPAIPFTGGSRE